MLMLVHTEYLGTAGHWVYFRAYVPNEMENKYIFPFVLIGYINL
jgi:hypothetical protein